MKRDEVETSITADWNKFSRLEGGKPQTKQKTKKKRKTISSVGRGRKTDLALKKKKKLEENCDFSIYIGSKVLTNRSILFPEVYDHFLLIDGTVFTQSAVLSLYLARIKIMEGSDDAYLPQTDPGSQ